MKKGKMPLGGMWSVGPHEEAAKRAWRLCVALAHGDWLRAHMLYTRWLRRN